MLEINNLEVQGRNNVSILTDVSLKISQGECVGLTGASGSGKTTLLKAVLGMEGEKLMIPKGEILLDGENLLEKSVKHRRRLCGKILGFIPQNPMTAFFAYTKIGNQMIETLRLHTGLSRHDAEKLAVTVLQQVNLKDTSRVMNACPGELSGGMLQRVAMALILGVRPKYVLADEPTSALDEANRNQLLKLLEAYKKQAGILFISHDIEAMQKLCGLTHVMDRGRIIETQPTKQLFVSPKQPWTRKFSEAAKSREEVNWHWSVLN